MNNRSGIFKIFIIYFLICLALFFLVNFLQLTNHEGLIEQARIHGVEKAEEKPDDQLVYEIDNSHIDQSQEVEKLDIENDNFILIFYRTDCEDCQDMFKQIKRTNIEQEFYYVCSRTECGKALTERYNIKEVPSVYVNQTNSYCVLDTEAGSYYEQLKKILEKERANNEINN